MWRRMLPALAVAAAGCGESERPAPPRPAHAAAAAASAVLARDAHLHPGAQRVHLLSVPQAGRLIASCDRHGRPTTTFAAARGTASADVVVQSGDRTSDGVVDAGKQFAPGFSRVPRIEQWRVAEFTKAHAAILTMTVAARGTEFPPDGCAVSVQATVSRPTTGTLTR